MWRLEVYSPDGKPALSLYQLPNKPVTLDGDPSYLEDMVNTINRIQFFRLPNHKKPCPNQN